MSGVRRPNDHLGILRQTIGEIYEIGNSVNPEDALELIYGCEGVHAHATALVRENGTIGDGDTVYFDGHTAEGLSLEALSNSLGALKLDVSRKNYLGGVD